MFLLRLLAILTFLSVAGGFAAWLLTRNARYLAFSWQVLRYAVVVALMVFGLMIAERVLVIPV